MMRTDEPAVLVTKDELISGLTRWRLNEIDRISTEILLDEQLRQVAFAMAEPPPRQPLAPLNGAIWFGVWSIVSGWGVLIAFGGYMIFQIVR